MQIVTNKVLTLKDDDLKVKIVIQGESDSVVNPVLKKATEFIKWASNPAQMQFNLTADDLVVLDGGIMLRMEKPKANSKKGAIGLTTETTPPETLSALYNYMQAGRNPSEVLIRYTPKPPVANDEKVDQ
jgi:hypothetical protein